MNLRSAAVRDVVATAARFVLSCEADPLALANDEQERLFLDLCEALHFLQTLAEREAFPRENDAGA